MPRSHRLKNTNPIYLVKDLAREAGFSVYTVEYYLNLGLLHEIGRGPYTGYRYFGSSAVRRLRRIRELRKKGLGMTKIKILLQKKKEIP